MNSTERYFNKMVLCTLKQLAYTIGTQISRVNHGGCGYVASTVCKHLNKIGVDAEVVSNAMFSNSFPSNIKKEVKHTDAPRKWFDAGLNNDHLAVRFKLGKTVYTWDTYSLMRGGKKFCDFQGTGTGWFDCKYPFGEGLRACEVDHLVSNPNLWNDDFDRGQVPQLKRLVREAFTM